MTEEEARTAYREAAAKASAADDEVRAAKGRYRDAVLDRLRAESKIAEAIYGVPGILLESHGYLRSRPRLRALDREGSALYRADVGVGSKKEWGYWIRTPDGRIEKVWLPGQPKPPAGGRWKHVEVEL